MIKTIAIIPAAGSGTRTGLNINKVLLNTGAIPIITCTLMPFIISPIINKIIIVINRNDQEIINNTIKNLNSDKEIITVIGGDTRTDSVRNALPYTEGYDITLIHDAARPFVTIDLIEKVVNEAALCGAATAAIPVIDTIKRVKNGKVISTLNREEYQSIQTPQAFNSKSLIDAYKKIKNNYTDDSAIYEEFIGSVSVIYGSPQNIKITTADDLTRYFPKGYRVGVGYDVHRLIEGRKLILGGIEIPNHKGLLGHSDADCLIHSIMDAILTATGNRDIGILFPDNDNKYLGISSLILLEKVYNIISEQGFIINNISAEIIAEKPKLMSFIPSMQGKIAEKLNIEADKVSLAATTSEGLGITGQEQAIAVYSVCSVLTK